MEQHVEPRRPRVVLVVDNHVSVDSRVQKTARASADAGYDTVIVGRSTTGARVETVIGGVRTILLDAPRHMMSYAIRQPSRGHRPLAYRSREQALDVSRALQAKRAGQLEEMLDLRGQPGGIATKARVLWLKGRVSWRQRLHNRRYRDYQANCDDVANNRGPLRRPALRAGLTLAPRRTWRRIAVELLDYDLAFAPELAALEPDLIHVHDFSMLVVATNARARARQAGRTVALVHDVHEWIAGAPRRDPVWRRAVHQAEIELIPAADAVVTVSDWLAESLQRDCRLAVRPTVITNAPEPPDVLTASVAPSVRVRAGVPDGVPLMVYSGAVAPGRGIATAVDALPDLPDVHLVVVVGAGPHLHMDELVARATELGAGGRIHRVDYVPQELVVAHLASADIGLIPLEHAVNHEISLITKYREYMHARLPIVVSDVRTMAEFTRAHRTGEVFAAGDRDAFVLAVRAVLADPAGYRAAYTDELLAEHSWPVQAARLVEVYAGLLGPAPAPEAPRRELPMLPTVTEPVALVIGPTNMAGQGFAWAQVASRLDGVDAVTVAMARSGVLEFPTDLRIAVEDRADPAWIARFEREVGATRSHVLLENALTLDGSSSAPLQVEAQIARFQAAGLSVALAFHGSEVRDPRVHAESYPWSNFRDADPTWRAALERRVDEVMAVVRATGLPAFVSTPDQLRYLPDAVWLPTVVDAARFATEAPVLERDVPVVLHAPSRAATKGSAAIDPVLERLEREGLIVYRRLVGVRPERMPREVAAVDVVVEQVGLGLYGVFAAEAMAAGRLVVGQVGAEVRDRVRAGTGLEVPVVEAGAATIEEVLRAVLADRAVARAVAASGPAYVADVHDGRRAAVALATWLGVPLPR